MKDIDRIYNQPIDLPEVNVSENKVVPKVPWTLEMFDQKVKQIDLEITECNQNINSIDSRINDLRDNRKQVCLRAAKKWAYRKLLIKNIREYFPNSNIK